MEMMSKEKENGVEMRIVEEKVNENEERKRRMELKVIEEMGGEVEGIKIEVMGMKLKKEKEDMRDENYVKMIEKLKRFGESIRE